MGKTIAGAASGETGITAPKDSQSQAKGQEKIMCKHCTLFHAFLRLVLNQSFFIFQIRGGKNGKKTSSS
jgi:hypothetical protein